MRKGHPEFLLVQTRGGRWIFPKGGVEPGLSYAQSAALEAFEEAGVHGRMEQIPFTRYFRRPPANLCDARTKVQSANLEAVAVHLCEVSRLEAPQESNRNPTWFSAEKAKQRLLDDRAPTFGHELARVVDRAVSRILRLHDTARISPNLMQKDPLQEVRFQAFEDGRWHNPVAAKVLKPRSGSILSTAIELAMQAQLKKLTEMGGFSQFRPAILRLGTGADSASPKITTSRITTIDSKRKGTTSNSSQFPSHKRRVPKS